ncbi:MAG: DUF3048 C-terminal domain-containing protein [Clostridia bacterium]|nr:DUF3048 C-terminal domain-containing protein [Clostridia bacterium]
MKSFKLNGLKRPISFALIAILLLSTVAFAASGAQSGQTDKPDSGKVDLSTDNTDENKDGNKPNTDNSQNNTPPVEDNTDIPNTNEPTYINPITGLEVSREQSERTPIGFVFNPEMPLYGVSNSDLTIEFPIEDGSSRILSYTTNTGMLWKVGALAPTRDYISSISNFFGGIIVANGNDDSIKYSAWDGTPVDLDISKFDDSFYVENSTYVYTGKDMLNAAISKSPALIQSSYKSAPYAFANGETVLGATKAESVIIPFSERNQTEFYYSEQTGQYLYFKSGSRKIDMLNGKNLAFTNVFVLFADATTYEKAEGCELVIDTTGGGTGYYFSMGRMCELRWSIGDDG